MKLKETSTGASFIQTDRKYGGTSITAMSIDSAGSVAIYKNLTINNGAYVASNSSLKVYYAAGVAAAGPVTVTGTKVGDKIVSVCNLTDNSNGTSSFESTVTVADQIHQSSASNLTTKTFMFLTIAKPL